MAEPGTNFLQYFDRPSVGVKYRGTGPQTRQGYPVPGDVNGLSLNRAEYDNLPIAFDVKVRVFDLSEAGDLEAYRDTLDRIANKIAIRIDKTKLISPDGGRIKIHLEWAEPRGVIPPGMGR